MEQQYIITEKTIAIFPAKQIDYQSIAIEKDTTKQIQQTPIEIMHQSCLTYWSSFEGRREAVMTHTGYKEKVPIPINIHKEIIAIPTHGLRHIDCSWLMLNHILHYERNGNKKTTITFTNKKSTTLNISIRSFQSQFKRALEIKHQATKDLQ